MKAAVILFPGSNRDGDVARALAAATGHAPTIVWHARARPAGRHRSRRAAGRLLLRRLSALRRDCRPRADHGRGAGACGARRPGARHLQRLPDPVRRRPAARRADAQRATCGSSAGCSISRSSAPTRPTPATTRPGRSSRSRSRMAKAITRPTRRRSRGSKARAASPSAIATRDGAVGGDRESERLDQRTSPASIRETRNVLGMMPHPENLDRSARRRHRRPRAVRRLWRIPLAAAAVTQSSLMHDGVIAREPDPNPHHARARRRARPEAGRIRAPPRAHRPHADLHRTRHLLGHVERALLVQILAPASAQAADQARPG